MSKPVLRHYGKIVNGKKVYYNPELYKHQIDSLEGQEFEEVIKKRFKKVSEDQHSYYRKGVLGTCIQHEEFIHFNKPDDIHTEIIAPMFLGYTVRRELKGKIYESQQVRSTADLSKEEMAEFIDKVIMWLASEMGIVVYSPEQYYLSQQNKQF